MKVEGESSQPKAKETDLSEETSPIDSFILGLQLPELRKTNFCCLRHQVMVFCHGDQNRPIEGFFTVSKLI
jgi:hypothetical protein